MPKEFDDQTPRPVFFCPQCLEKFRKRVEMDQELAFGQQEMIPAYWSNLTAYVLGTCPDCGYQQTFDLP